MSRPAPSDELLALLSKIGYRPPGGLLAPAVAGALTLDDRGVLGRIAAPLPALARGLSERAGGLWIASEAHLTWVNGRRVAEVVDVSHYDTVTGIRVTLSGGGIAATAWSVGGCCRQALRWCGVRQIPRAETVRYLQTPGWAYHSWQPGVAAEAGLYDLVAAYYSALCRMPSPVLQWDAGGPLWHALAPAERARWQELLALAGTCKRLRLLLVGCMHGSGGSAATYHAGRRLKPHRECGPLKHAALLAIRTAYELTALAVCEESALWSHTDAVVLPGAARPRAWDRYGYAYREQARGYTEICHANVYRVGDRVTAYYRPGANIRLPAYQPGVPSPLCLPAWC